MRRITKQQCGSIAGLQSQLSADIQKCVSPDDVNVVSWNVRNGWTDEYAPMLAATGVDFICLQEVGKILDPDLFQSLGYTLVG